MTYLRMYSFLLIGDRNVIILSKQKELFPQYIALTDLIEINDL